MPSASPIPRAVARPIRIEVKLPGPVPTTSASRSPSASPASCTSSSAATRTERASVRRSPAVSPSQTRAQVVTCVAVSKAKIVLTLDPDLPVALVDVLERHRGAQRRQPAAGVLGPLHEANRAIEVRLQIGPPFPADSLEPVEVEMADRDTPGVTVADRER